MEGGFDQANVAVLDRDGDLVAQPGPLNLWENQMRENVPGSRMGHPVPSTERNQLWKL